MVIGGSLKRHAAGGIDPARCPRRRCAGYGADLAVDLEVGHSGSEKQVVNIAEDADGAAIVHAGGVVDGPVKRTRISTQYVRKIGPPGEKAGPMDIVARHARR